MLGNTIKEIRKSRGYSQKKFAETIGLTNSYYNTIENGALPSIKILRKIAGALNVNLSVLFLHSIDREDISEEKRNNYDIIMPTIKELIMSLF